MINSVDVPLLAVEEEDSNTLFSLLEDRDEETFILRCAENRDQLDKDTKQCRFTYVQLDGLYGLPKSVDWLSMNSEDPNPTGHSDQSIPIIQCCSNYRGRLDDDIGQFKLTYLQLACLYGLPKAVEALLKNGVDPNRTGHPDQCSPIMIAAWQGHYDIVKMLAQHKKVDYKTNRAVTKSTLLHLVLYGMRFDRDCGNSHSVMEKCISCIKLLLEKRAFTLRDINAPDKLGFTALHLALHLQEKSIILLLLEHGAYIGSRCNRGDTAISLMSPDVFEEYLNNCIYTNGKQPIDEDYQIIYDYGFLDPQRIYRDKPEVTQDNHNLISQTEPLIEISRVPELRHLLKHPVLANFLHVKWYTLRKYFWINFTFYLAFLFWLTLHTLALYSSNDADEVEQLCTNKTIEYCEKNPTCCCFPVACCINNPACWTWYPSTFLCGLLGLREFFKFCALPTQYLRNVGNFFVITLLTLNILILLHKVRAGVAAIALLLTWTEMVLLINRHPSLSSNFEMCKAVCTSFLKLLAWWSMLIVAFALSFYLLFKDDANADVKLNNNNREEIIGNLKDPKHQKNNETDNNYCMGKNEDALKFFENKTTSLFKVVLMMTGEFEASLIPFNRNPGISHMMFILFVFLVSIILFNLMNGLAVSDTQAIINDAKIVGYATLAKQITSVEQMAVIYENTIDILFCKMTSNPIRKGRMTEKLFPYELSRVFILPNQSSRVSLMLGQKQGPGRMTKSFSSIPHYDKYTNWWMVLEIMNETKKILQERKSKREENKHPSNSPNGYSERLEKCSEKLETYSEKLLEYENRILQEQKNLREENEHFSNSLNQYSEKLEKCSEKLETYSEKLEEYGSRLTLLELTTNRKLDTLIELLRQRN